MKLPARIAAILFMLAYSMDCLACAVCFGQSDSPFLKGMELSVLFMVIMTYLLIGGGVATVIILRRRQRSLGQTSDSA